jgi:hypothetical protein
VGVVESQSAGQREDPSAIAAAVDDHFADERPRFDGDDGTPFPPIARTGVMRNASVKRLTNEPGVRVALLYADAEVRDGGDMYCIHVEVPGQGGPRWTVAEADFAQASHCAEATAQPEWQTLRSGDLRADL